MTALSGEEWDPRGVEMQGFIAPSAVGNQMCICMRILGLSREIAFFSIHIEIVWIELPVRYSRRHLRPRARLARGPTSSLYRLLGNNLTQIRLKGAIATPHRVRCIY